VEIVPVVTRAQWRDFHRLPHRVYRDDPNWIAPLLLERKFHFLPKHNPFFEHATAAFFLACSDGSPIGRISAQIDRLHLERYNDATGHFGFIEAVDDAGVFAALLRAAEDWLRERGIARVLGPVSFSLWDQPGLLVEGFDTPPYVMMGHARPYFARHIEAAGYRGVEDLIAYRYGPQMAVPLSMQRILERALRRGDIVVRTIRMDKRHVDDEIALLLDIINDAWSDNWGFVAMTKAEIDDLAGILKLLLRPGDVAIAEYQGKPAAFAAVFPNLNEAARDLDGRLWPLGWAKLLWRLKVRRPRSVRMPMMGVRKVLQTKPIGAALALAVIQATRTFTFAHGVVDSELSWILERNERVRHVIELVGGVPYKRYRIYEKNI
jgi:GNAT superfamily N-acetyltransferase